MCDLLDDPCALVSGPRKSQQGESLGMQLGELSNLIVMFIYSIYVTSIYCHIIISSYIFMLIDSSITDDKQCYQMTVIR
jgi:hypothetical protein